MAGKENPSVMLIDDNEIDLFYTEKLLLLKKFTDQIKAFQFATEALEILKITPYSDWPDIIMVDIHMPVMDGFEFVKAYSEINNPLKQKTMLIFVSSTLDYSDRDQVVKDNNVFDLLGKPLNIDELRQTWNNYP